MRVSGNHYKNNTIIKKRERAREKRRSLKKGKCIFQHFTHLLLDERIKSNKTPTLTFYSLPHPFFLPYWEFIFIFEPFEVLYKCFPFCLG